jgi:hypothetical protein
LVIGQGSCGNIHLADHLRPGRRVAVEQVHLPPLSDPDLLSFCREVGGLARCPVLSFLSSSASAQPHPTDCDGVYPERFLPGWSGARSRNGLPPAPAGRAQGPRAAECPAPRLLLPKIWDLEVSAVFRESFNFPQKWNF